MAEALGEVRIQSVRAHLWLADCRNRLHPNMRRREKVFSTLAVIGSFIGGAGLILLSIFDTALNCYDSNMLMLTFGTRTDTTADPLIERTLALATEFMGLTGNRLSFGSSANFFLIHTVGFQGHYPIS